MSDTSASVESSAMAALENNASAAALVSAAANAAASAAASTAAASSSLSSSTQGVNIKGLIPITLDMHSTCYRRWKTLFRIVLGRYDLISHVDNAAGRPNDPVWVQADLTVVMWLHATLSDDLMDMVLMDNPTAYRVWTKIQTFFTNNRASRAVDLEAELHDFEQGDLSVSDYCHRLQQIAHGLADCERPVGDQALVHQLIRGLDARFATLKTMLPALPQFPTFTEARDHLLREERSQRKKPKAPTTDTAMVASAGNTSSDGSGTHTDSGGRGNSSGNTRGGRSGGRGGRTSRGRGRGGGGRGYFNPNNNNGGRGPHPPQSLPAWIPYYPQWGGAPWRAPWTGSSGPGVLGTHPPAPAGQAYPVYQAPTTMSAPSSSSWDTNGLIAALQAASQPPVYNTQGGWYMDTGASTHMTGDQGSTNQENSHEIQ